ncbi:MAG TPA: ATP-dependent RecD-like DNA helicase, partial [Polyangia bacterium]
MPSMSMMDLFERAAGKREDTGAETVEGTLERIVYAGASGEFTVARLKVDGKPELLTVVGALLGVPVGARLRVVGKQESNPRFGPQLRIASFTEVAPATIE